jgi:hypothetical protein
MPDRAIPIRLDDAFIERLDRLAEALAERAAGAHVSRSSAIRVALDRGVGALEAELGLGKASKPKRKQ